MRVAMYYSNRDVRLAELPRPLVGAGELLVRVMASGICGSDVMEWYRRHKVPLVLGHEIAGEVVEVGPGLDRAPVPFEVGDRVVATHHVPCFACHYCLTGHETVCDTLLHGTHFEPGGFSEYLRLPVVNVRHGTWRLPADVSYEAGTFVEPLACVLRGQRLAGLRPAASVIVLGSGISGLLHINLAAALGAGLIVATDISEYRLANARRFGADEIWRADTEVAARFRRINHGRGADLVVVCTSADRAMKQALEVVGRGGTILFFAPAMEKAVVPLSINDLFWRRDVTLTSTYAGGPGDCVTALELIRQKRVRVEEMITHRFGLADSGQGFRLVAEAADSIKVIINPQE